MIYNKEFILNSFAGLIKDYSGGTLDSVNELKADASDRKIFRIQTGGKTLIGIYNENIKENRAFIYFSRIFIELKFKVPKIHCVSDDESFYLEEDLGDITLFGFSQDKSYLEMKNYYRNAIEDLTGFQLNAKDKIDFTHCVSSKELDSVIINSDINKFYNFFVKKFHKKNTGKTVVDENIIQEIKDEFISINSLIDNNYFMYRDFQPRNIMIKDGSLHYIDYQSGMKGPLQYDIASLLNSGSVSLKEEEKEELLDYYMNLLKKRIKIDEKVFKQVYFYYALLRIFQVLGSYGYQYEIKGNRKMLLKMKKALYNLEEIKCFISKNKMRDLIESLLEDANPH